MPYLRKRVKKGIIFENFGKNIQNLKIYEKVQPHSCYYHMHKTSRMCPVISVQVGSSSVKGGGVLGPWPVFGGLIFRGSLVSGWSR